MALVIWSTTTRVFHYPDTYNVPLHLLADRPKHRLVPPVSPLVHVHYHWLFTDPYYRPALVTLRDLRRPGSSRLVDCAATASVSVTA